MLFIEIPRAMGRGICIAAQKSNKPRKRLLKSKQMFIYKVIEKEVFAAGKDERERILGIRMVRCRIAARFGPFTLKGKRHKKGKPSEAKLAFSMEYEVKRHTRTHSTENQRIALNCRNFGINPQPLQIKTIGIEEEI